MIIGLHSKKRSGKDTLALQIVEKLQYRQLSFASKLKEIIKEYSTCVTYKEDDRESEQEYKVAKTDLKEIVSGLNLPLASFASMFYLKMEQYLYKEDKEYYYFKSSYRQFAQTLGTDVCRELDQNVWVRQVANEIGIQEDIVISDVRFDNEAEYIRELGGVVVEILRGETPKDSHASEQGISSELISFTVLNNHTKEGLFDQFTAKLFLTTRGEL